MVIKMSESCAREFEREREREHFVSVSNEHFSYTALNKMFDDAPIA